MGKGKTTTDSTYNCTQENNPGLQEMQTQVDEVVGILRGSIDKVLERDGNLEQLDARAKSLAQQADIFGKISRQALKQKEKEANKYSQFVVYLAILLALGVVAAALIMISKYLKSNPELQNTADYIFIAAVTLGTIVGLGLLYVVTTQLCNVCPTTKTDVVNLCHQASASVKL